MDSHTLQMIINRLNPGQQPDHHHLSVENYFHDNSNNPDKGSKLGRTIESKPFKHQNSKCTQEEETKVSLSIEVNKFLSNYKHFDKNTSEWVYTKHAHTWDRSEVGNLVLLDDKTRRAIEDIVSRESFTDKYINGCENREN